jgi:hypothetical protein
MVEELLDLAHAEVLDTTIELGIYDCAVGQMPGHNVLIWEVRTGY